MQVEQRSHISLQQEQELNNLQNGVDVDCSLLDI